MPRESVRPEETLHQIIEGDNLPVLVHLGETHEASVKLVYIDPPYNTGKDFTYRDSQKNDWVEMMRPRLEAALSLLRPDGAIVVHIDEHEHARLSLLLDEVFGRENRLGTIIWDKLNPKGDATGIATQHETILCHARDRATFVDCHPLVRSKENVGRMLEVAAALADEHGADIEGANVAFRQWIREQSSLSGGEAAYSRIDEDGRVFQAVSMAWPNKRTPSDDYFQPLVHPLSGKPCPIPARGWRNPPQTMARLLEEDRVVFGPTERTQPRRKYFLDETQTESIPSILRDGSSDDKLLGSLGTPFDHAKPLSVARRLIRWFTKDPGDLVLDFFAGSGTTGHAVLEENADHAARLRFILVQSPEPVVRDSQAQEAGFETVSALTRARVRRGIEALDADHGPGGDEDRGFRASQLSPEE
jgi:adenine-specific DNA-methyltransferase